MTFRHISDIADEMSGRGARTKKRVGARLKSITIQGRSFASRTEAANFYGLSVTTISRAERRGRLDYVGTGNEHKKRPVTIAGVDYPSRQAAASELGVCSSVMTHYLQVRDILAKQESDQ